MRKAKRWVKVLFCILLALVLLVGTYVAYVFIAYHRIGDQELTAQGEGKSTVLDTAVSYSILSYNIGFGAYEDDYGFFMDGGTESWAWSQERLEKNLADIAALRAAQKADFYFVQEVDADSTRTYHTDETALLRQALPGYSSVWGQNYDSPFLFWPLRQPHGASVSGLMTFSSVPISSSLRRSLPIESGVMKLVDLDRCYTVSRVAVENGRELVLFAVHLSAYTSDGTIAIRQMEMLLEDMQREYEKGNYCVCGGDFNKDLLGNSEEVFGISAGDYTWAQPLPEELFAGKDLTLVPPIDRADPVPSCRNADAPYFDGQYVVTVDGFLVSDNVTVQSARVIDTGFAYSDHNPVVMSFLLQP